MRRVRLDAYEQSRRDETVAEDVRLARVYGQLNDLDEAEQAVGAIYHDEGWRVSGRRLSAG